MTKQKINYCCSRFKESVEGKKFLSVYDKKILNQETIIWHFTQQYKGKKYVNDKNIHETEWFMPEWLHIYYCPFCGKFIKGKGYGVPARKLKK